MPKGIFQSPALPFVGKLPRLSKARLPYLHNENKDSSTSLWECRIGGSGSHSELSADAIPNSLVMLESLT